MRWPRHCPRARGDGRADLSIRERSQARRRTAMKRTAKSCGSDAPGLASSFAEASRPDRAQTKPIREMTVTTKPGRRGEHEVSRKTIACGNAGCSGGPVVTTLVGFILFAREAAGALGARHSPRPHFCWANELMHNSGAIALRDRAVIFGIDVIGRSDLSAAAQRAAASAEARRAKVEATKQLIFTFWRHGLLRGARHRVARSLSSGARSRDPWAPTRWLAMTA
jgi:hypothetical protein